jgi:hypothetical protein
VVRGHAGEEGRLPLRRRHGRTRCADLGARDHELAVSMVRREGIGARRGGCRGGLLVLRFGGGRRKKKTREEEEASIFSVRPDERMDHMDVTRTDFG